MAEVIIPGGLMEETLDQVSVLCNHAHSRSGNTHFKWINIRWKFRRSWQAKLVVCPKLQSNSSQTVTLVDLINHQG